MPKYTTCRVVFVLLLFFTSEVGARDLSLSIKLLDASHKYKVKSSDIVAELIFPSQVLVGQIEYTHKTSNASLSFSLEHSLSSSHPTGTDTDWYQGNISVYSQSKTSLEKYYAFNLNYERAVLKNLSIRTTVFHKYWKLNWSDTKQYTWGEADSVPPGESVKFEQTLNGIGFNLQYREEMFSIPVSVSLGAQAAKHRSVDEHILNNFYIVSQDWLYGYIGSLSAELIKNKESVLELMASYEVLSGDSDMKFYTNSDFNYLTLPASFETKQKSIQFKYTLEF